VQLDVIRGATLPSSELKFRLHSLFFDIRSKGTHYYCIIDFATIFKMLESVFAVELDVPVQVRSAILADQLVHGQLRRGLAEDRLRCREVSVGELVEQETGDSVELNRCRKYQFPCSHASFRWILQTVQQ
jgi:hypothetical protein